MDKVPLEIRLRKKSRLLTISFQNGRSFDLPFEYLRVSSPSAEVRGHGPGEGTLQVNKQNVEIDEIEPIGHYAIKIIFNDGHDTGLYTWDYLYELGSEQQLRWQEYLDRLAAEGYAR
tara:strand:+ start:590 stop:940 length:351 start_codon:yes stop_codon:yes gene_type:complete